MFAVAASPSLSTCQGSLDTHAIPLLIQPTIPVPRSPMPEEEQASVALSQHDGSSGDEARGNASTDSAGGSKKRKRGRYQKTS